MNQNELKRLVQIGLAKLLQQGPGRHLMVRIALLAISALLTYLGVDTADLFEDDVDDER